MFASDLLCCGLGALWWEATDSLPNCFALAKAMLQP